MARPKKEGKRATGIQSKKGYLYIVTSHQVIKDGVKKTEKRWTATELMDTPENVKSASEIRRALLTKKNKNTLIDRNISVADYTDLILSKKRLIAIYSG